MKKLIFGSGIIFYILILSGCKPYATIGLSPETVCLGDVAWVKWSTYGLSNKTLTRNGETVLGIGSVRDRDSIRANQTERSTYRIEGITKGTTLGASVTSDVLTVGESRLKLFNFSWPGCIGEGSGRYPILNDLSIGGSIEIQSVANQSSRRIRVSHLGRTADLNGSESTTVFNGQALAGDWTVVVLDLMSNEGCRSGDVTTGEIYTDPPNIGLGVTYGCR